MTPFSWGRRGLFQCIATPRPISHSANSVGKSPREPQGQPLSTRKRPGNPQRTEGQSELLLHGLRGTFCPSPEGGKPRSTAPLRCIRRSGEASLLLRDFVIRICSFASICQVSWGAVARSRWARGGRPAGAGDRSARTNQRWRVRSEGTGRPGASRRSCTRIRPAPQVGCSRRSFTAVCTISEGTASGGRAVAIIWWDAVATAETKPLEETADGRARQAQRRGDLAGPAALFARAGTSPDGSGRGWDVAWSNLAEALP